MRATDAHDIPADLARWGLHAFALGARSTPHPIVAMDDNGALLYHARHGATPAELAEHGITPSESRLELLRVYGLIETDGDVVTTAFPVVGPEILDELRPRVRQEAAALVPRIRADVGAIAAELHRRGHPGHDYAVVFGHAVDGLLWDRLRAHGLAPTTELSVERPFWNGAFWAIYPPNEGGAGVNELPGPEATLVMVWTHDTNRALWDLARTEEGRRLLAAPTAQNKIPVLAPEDGDVLHRHSLSIAETITGALRSTDLLSAIPDATPKESTLVLAHELIWSLMRELLDAELLRLPEGMLGQGADHRALNQQLLLRLH